MKKGFKSFNVFTLVILSIITLGIYIPFWFFRKIKEVENSKLHHRVAKGWIYFLLILSILGVGASILSIFFPGLFQAERFSNYLGWTVGLILSFGLRDVLKEYYIKKKTHFSVFWTIIFGPFYLQFMINKLNPKKK